MRRSGTFRAVLLGAAVVACGGSAKTPAPPAPAPSPRPAVRAAAPEPKVSAPPLEGASENPEVARRFEHHLAHHRDATYADLVREAGVAPEPTAALDFDPRTARYFDLVADRLAMTKAERERFLAQGVVGVDIDRPSSMANAYLDIYTHDLPVLITSDSMLDALHRSYDTVVKELEGTLLLPALRAVLEAAHEELGARAPEAAPALSPSFADVDLYLAVARSLLAGAGAARDGSDRSPYERGPFVPTEPIPSKLGQDARVRQVVGDVSSLSRKEGPSTALYGGARPIDYSQFRPRGHYTEWKELGAYFRAMAWLGRADTGFFLTAPSAGSGITVDVARERRSAALLTELLARSRGLERLGAMSDLVGFLVGNADSLEPRELHAALTGAKLLTFDDLTNDAQLTATYAGLGAGSQQITSQFVRSPEGPTEQASPPGLFQTFGQRFLLDSFVLSEVVYDTIVFRGEKQRRTLPSPLDVMAALGSDEAVRLLAPELERYHYAGNLLSAREVVEDLTPEAWSRSLYTRWLDAIRSLDDEPGAAGHVPRVLRGSAWAKKQLRTQLGSWAELRHDTLLYAKQSYGPQAACEYPDAFVEPYPQFYEKLSALAGAAATRLSAIGSLSGPLLGDGDAERRARSLVDQQARFFRHFASVQAFLATLARKELAARPFSPEEILYLKSTIDLYRISGGAHYDGWYATLVYGEGKEKYKPTIADVHTDPGGDGPPRALEVGTGSPTFLVVAIDNESDRAVYVGPTFSYYELTVPPSDRMTDEVWAARLEKDRPKPPEWTWGLDLGPTPRELSSRTAPSIRTEADLTAQEATVNKLRALEARIAKMPPAEREKHRHELEDVQESLFRIGGCGCPPHDDQCPCVR